MSKDPLIKSKASQSDLVDFGAIRYQDSDMESSASYHAHESVSRPADDSEGKHTPRNREENIDVEVPLSCYLPFV